MASTIVDGLLANAAGATTGVNLNKPKMGGVLTVGLLADMPNYHTFNGAQGKMDDSGFCVANALYDPLFVSAVNGKAWLPMLALSASHNANYTVWTVALRHGVTFSNGEPFNAAIVVQNFQAAQADQTVGLAIQPVIKSCVAVGTHTVTYTLVNPFSTFPYGALCEQQTSYMAHPTSFAKGFTGNPIGTGPFKFKSWTPPLGASVIAFTKNKRYWRKDAAGRKLPYLDGVVFKTIADSNARNQALQTGAIDMMIQQDGPSIAALAKMAGVRYRTDMKDPRDPSVNCLIMNTTGTMSQYFAWAGEFAPQIKGGLSYLQAGQAIPPGEQLADFVGTLGAVDPSTGQWNLKLKPVVSDVTIRQACAMAINRQTYFKVIDGGVGAVADGIYRHSSPNYSNPHYPAYNPAQARALVNAYKAKNSVTSVSFVIDILAADNTAQRQFAFFQSQLQAVGITVTSRPKPQSTLIQNVIIGEYDCATWNQFGGADPALNYVWFNSFPATAAYPAGLGLTSLPAGTMIAGAVNFSHLGDPVVEQSMLSAMAARGGSAAQHADWAKVNAEFAKKLPYLFLDLLVSGWAARSNVQNWAYATAGDGKTRCMNPDGGSTRWDQIWKS